MNVTTIMIFHDNNDTENNIDDINIVKTHKQGVLITIISCNNCNKPKKSNV